ncbi:MAG: gliding motility-associated C-terminal domain-containing protein [Bacteroidetes bacterium]|nr:gliding motility-associated C-terminal domain-containing protein [Bacteroidota bacterium]
MIRNIQMFKEISKLSLNLLGYLIICLYFTLISQNLASQNSLNSNFETNEFVKNNGQIYDMKGNLLNDVKFVLRLKNANAYFTNTGIIYHLYKTEKKSDKELSKEQIEKRNRGEVIHNDSKTYFFRIDMNFINPNSNAEINGEQESKVKTNYYLASCPNGVIDVPQYKKITYKNIFQNIDLTFYFKDGNLKYDFIVRPGGNINDIKMSYNGSESVKLNENGSITIKTPMGLFTENSPFSYLLGTNNILESKLQIEKDIISFQVEDYDKGKTIIIDPVIGWATYFNSSTGSDSWSNATVDNSGNIFWSGYTFSTTFPVLDPGSGAWFDGTFPATFPDISDLIVVKFDQFHSKLWATYYGGNNGDFLAGYTDYGKSMAIDNSGNIFIAGNLGMGTTIFPTFDPGGGAWYQNQTKIKGESSFLLKFSNSGVRLWATIFEHENANNNPSGNRITGIVSNSNNLFITGQAQKLNNNNIPLRNPGAGAYYEPNFIGQKDAFIGRFSPTLNLDWNTYINSANPTKQADASGLDLCVDKAGNIYLVGIESGNATLNDHHPIINPGGGAYIQALPQSSQNFQILKFNSSLVPVWSTYFGGNNTDIPSKVTVDALDNLFIIGRYTNSTNFPTLDAGGGAYYQPNLASSGPLGFDGFILKFSSSSNLKWSTYYGGGGFNAFNHLSGIATDVTGNIYVSGYTNSTLFPVQSKLGSYNQMNNAGGNDGVFMKFTNSGVRQWSTYYGGSNNESFYGEKLGLINYPCGSEIYAMGGTTSDDIPTFDPGNGALYESSKPTSNADFIVMFSDMNVFSVDPTSILVSQNPICPGDSVILTVNGGLLGTAASWYWYISGNIIPIDSGASITVSPNSITTYEVRAEGMCNITNAISVTVNVSVESIAPTMVTVDNGEYCLNTSPLTITLTANGGLLGSGATVNWFSGSCGGTFVGTGSPLTITAPTDSTVFFANYSGLCNSTSCVSVPVNVNTLTIPPVSAIVSPAIFCQNTAPAAITLTATAISVGSGAAVNWYTGGCNGTFIGAGNPLIIPAPDTTTAYFVSYIGICNSTACASTQVTVESPSIAPTSIIASQNPVCIPNSVTLSVVGGSLGIGASWKWYMAGNPISIGSGPSINVAPVATTIYFVRAEGFCNITNSVSITITVRIPSIAPNNAIVNTNNYCSNSAPANITLTASGGSLGSGAIVNWFSGGCGVGFVGTGSSIIIPAPLVTTTYYANYSGFCNTTNCVSVTVNVNQASIAPVSVIPSVNNYCNNNIPANITLTANGGVLGTGATINWYSNACGNGLIGNTNPISIPAPNVNTTYWVNYSGLCNTTVCTPVNISVLPVANATINPVLGIICQNQLAFNLSSVNPGGLWTGSGITNSALGTFNPSIAGSGVHQIIYTIANPCGDSDTINITVNPVILISISPVSPLCLLDTAMNLIANQPGGVWSGNGITDAINGVFDPTVAGVGIHQIIYTIAGVCQSSDTISIIVNANSVATINPVGNFCINDPASNLTSLQNGGIWSGNGITDALNGTFNPLIAGVGIHQIIYTISGSCSSSDTINVVVDSLLVGIISPQPALCTFDSAVTLTASEIGGTWSGTGIVDNSLGIFDPAVAGVGIHQIIYALIGPCSGNDTIMITVNTGFNATILPVGSLCINDSNINLISVQNGGVWSGIGIIDSNLGIFSPSVSGAGTFQIIYTISGICGNADTVNITVNPLIPVSITPVSLLCNSGVPIGLNANLNGGIWSGNGITDSLNGIFDPSIAGLGTHQIIYTLLGLCGGSDTIQIDVVLPTDPTINPVGLLCTNSGVTNLTSASLSGIWSGNGIIDSITGAFDPNIAGPGFHQIVFTANPCGNSDTVNILVNLSSNAQINMVDTVCIKDSIFNFTATQIGGIWSGNGIIDSLTGLFDPSIAGGGNHPIVYTISGPCGDSDTLNVFVSNVLNATIESVSLICINRPPFLFSSMTPGGIWSGIGIIDSLTGLFNPSIAGLGIHQITYTILGSCGASDTAFIEVNAAPNVLFTSTDESCNGADDGTITLIINGGQPPYSISWNNGSSLNNLDNLQPGTYGVSVSDTNGCQATDSLIIQGSLINCDYYIPHVYVPNIFSPNGDNVNDVLFVRGKGVVKLMFVIYDRWGEKVFETTDMNNGWDGIYKGKLVDPSVFVYYLKADLDNGEKIDIKGNVTLVR